jgi:hypothetical protein
MITRGVRDLDFIISQIQYDFLEDDEDVCGSWRIRQAGNEVHILYTPYNDSSAPVAYPAKASRYRLTRIEAVEGDDAEEKFDEWIKES